MSTKVKQPIVKNRQADDPKKYLIQGPTLLMVPLLIAYLFCAMLLANCKNSGSGDSSENGEDSTPEVNVALLTKDKAINLVQLYIYSHPREIKVQETYTEYRSERVPCTQYDKDRGVNCTGEGIGAPYGYQYVQKAYPNKCCRDRVIRINAGSGRWNAIIEEKEWKVELSMDDIKKTASWIVNDKSSEIREGNIVSK